MVLSMFFFFFFFFPPKSCYHDNLRTPQPIGLKFIGIVDMGREMYPIGFGDHLFQNGWLIGGLKVKFLHIAQ